MSILMFNRSLFARGSIHQGHEQFSDESRGRQSAFMSLSAQLCQQSLPIQQRSSERINQILLEGDHLFLNALITATPHLVFMSFFTCHVK